MITETPKRLPMHLSMPCYACEERSATHVCRFKVGELTVQVCLCPLCMQIDTLCLLKNTIGIQDIGQQTTPGGLTQGL
jgi:hypothetical protein